MDQDQTQLTPDNELKFLALRQQVLAKLLEILLIEESKLVKL
jgi:hypothetical protein